jgi:ribosome-associated protein
VNDGLRLAPGLTVPAAELTWRFSRSGGPGGQSVNTADSRVELIFDLAATQALPDPLKQRALRRLEQRLVNGTLVVAATEHRSQLLNRQAAMARMTSLLVAAIAPPPRTRRPTRPSRGAVQARLDAKKRNAEIKRNRRQPPEQ